VHCGKPSNRPESPSLDSYATPNGSAYVRLATREQAVPITDVFGTSNMFFTYDQTNSGGSFIGPARFVIVEADTAVEANHRAKRVGVCFDGMRTGIDCSDCGDRWLRAREQDATVEPMVYGDPLAAAWVSRDDGVRPTVLVAYADGHTTAIDALPLASDRPDRSGPAPTPEWPDADEEANAAIACGSPDAASTSARVSCGATRPLRLRGFERCKPASLPRRSPSQVPRDAPQWITR